MPFPRGLGPFLARNWPLILEAGARVNAFVTAHPDAPAVVRQRAELVNHRIGELRARRAPDAQVRAVLDMVRHVADDCAAMGASAPVSDIRIGEWRRQADRLDQALGVAQVQEGRQRRRLVARVKAQAETLAGEVFEAVLPEVTGTSRHAGAAAPPPAPPRGAPQQLEAPPARPQPDSPGTRPAPDADHPPAHGTDESSPPP